MIDSCTATRTPPPLARVLSGSSSGGALSALYKLYPNSPSDYLCDALSVVDSSQVSGNTIICGFESTISLFDLNKLNLLLSDLTFCIYRIRSLNLHDELPSSFSVPVAACCHRQW